MTILTPANAFPNLPFPQHGTIGQFDPANTNAAIALSNSNLSASSTSTGSSDHVSRTTNLHSSGKYYFEVVVNTYTVGSGNEIGIGLIDASGSLSAYLGSDTHSIGVYVSAQIFYGGSNVATATSFTTSSVVQIAVDITNGLFWAAVGGGIWNNSAGNNPATGVGGVSFGFSSPYAAIVLRQASTGLEAITARFQPSSFGFSIPSGFSAWGSGQTNTVQSFTYPGAVWPNVNPPPPSVLSYTNAFPNYDSTARKFNGSTDIIVSASTITIPSSSPFSYSVWVKPSGSIATMAAMGNNGSNEINANTGVSTFLMGFTTVTGGALALNQWYHLAMSGTLGGSFSGYLNGTNQGSGTAGATGFTTKLNIAQDGGGSNLWNGSIADPAVWNVALSGTDIAALAAGTRPGTIQPGALQIWYPLGLGSPEPDKSGNANNGTITGSPSIVVGPPLKPAAFYTGLAFPQHLSGQTNTVQTFLFPGAVQPQVNQPATSLGPIAFSILSNIITQTRVITY